MVAAPASEGRASRTYVFWGALRLDNRAELAARLGLAAGRLASLTDEDLVLLAYEAWKSDCAERLLGDFAFAIHEPETGRTFCCRDPAGVRSLYYGVAGGHLVLGRDIETLLDRHGISAELDDAYMAGYLLDRTFSHAEATFFKHVRKVPAGHTMWSSGTSISTSRYWPPEVLPACPCSNAEDAADALRSLVIRAVRDRVRDREGVGVHLTGGLDSSSIAAIAASDAHRDGRRPPDAFCWQAEPAASTAEFAEHRCIKAVARLGRLRVQYVPPQTDTLVDLVCGDGARRPANRTLGHELFVQLAAQHGGVTHILSGWGGQEFISSNGAGHLAALLAARHWRELYEQIRGRPQNAFRTFLGEAVRPHLPAWLQPQRRRRRRNRRRSLINPDFLRSVAPLEAAEVPTVGAAARMLSSLPHHLTERIESWAIHGARHGVTYSYPLLDRRILEFALTVPPAYYYRDGRTRWLMRRAMEPCLPAEVCWNTDKSDRARAGTMRERQPELWGAVRRRLEARRHPPPRAKYVDMRRLMAALAAGERAGSRIFSAPWAAVSILGLGQDEP